MRLRELFVRRLTEDDAEHQRTLDRTGFWGKAGAGCLVLARRTGRFLVAHRSSAVGQPGTWGTWGGAIDSREDPAEAVRREMREETGYRGDADAEPLFVYRSGGFRYHNFLLVVDDEFAPRLDWENQGFRWCEWGRWPAPMHFGLTKLLADAQSAERMKALAQGGAASRT